ncbi:MlaD family protein [Amphritea japonica]|uniref:Paraquat-inducible protein B n=1 Tax=Amphritea japonica ATCC BAA-1530 TaxID=1278309 RepID=A0A7R6PJ59_9GAMM|nr:MlaD family protein [Amphritea japonica]BBB27462.1 paraquat-inducible protein B [Amphritea japonica ATCC BAA-1530]
MSTPASDNNAATPIIKRHKGPSVVWLLPFLAALIAGWLVIKSYQDAGIMIEVQFETAEGLEAGVTKVMYRGLPTGMIKSLKLNEDLKSVTAMIEMEKETSEILVEGSRFWLVKPQISLSGVKGLNTLLSGYYIELQPGSGHERLNFIADNEPPPPLKDRKGLYLSLLADSAQSIQRGAKVYHRQIEVGEVINFGLTNNASQIRIELFIEPAYSHLISDSTRFWNASGISLKANLSQVNLRFGSLAAIIAGGISFYTPPDDDSKLTPDHEFNLFPDFEAAEDGLVVNVKFPARTDMHEGIRVMSEGIQIGRVQSLELSSDLSTLNARLLIDPRARPLLRSGSQFWLPKPTFSLTQLQNIGELIQGSAVQLLPGPGTPQFEFSALNRAPARRPGTAGLDISFESEQLGSINFGSPIMYRQIPVGEVRGYELTGDGSKVLIHGTIRQEYSNLVKRSSRFWEESGIKLKAGVDGVELKSSSLSTVINGGIGFFTPDIKDQKPVGKDQKFHLFRNFDNASQHGRLLYRENADKLPIRVKAESLGSITSGAPVLYKQLQVGSVSHYALSAEDDSVVVHLLIDKPYRHLVTDQSRFWNASGIDASLSPSGVNIHSESFQTLLRGGIAFANLQKNGDSAVNRQMFTLFSKRTKALQRGPSISVTFPAGPDITTGAKVRFKGLEMGEVEQVTLVDNQGTIKANIALTYEGRLLAHQHTQFWIAAPRINLSGVDYPETLIQGNHIEALPGNGNSQLIFTGLPERPANRDLPGLNIILETQQLGSLDINSNLYFRGMPVGSVSGYELSEDSQTVRLFINIKTRYKKLVTPASQFWNIGGINAEFGLFKGLKVETTNLESFVQGGIAFSTSRDMGQPVTSGYKFQLHGQEPD